MPRQSAVVTDAELSVLDFLWSQSSASVRDIAQAVYQKNTAAYHATVNSLLDQLEAKGYVHRDRSNFAHLFSAKVDRSVVVGKQIQQIADRHFDGALSPMFLALVENMKLKPKDLKAIRRIVDDID